MQNSQSGCGAEASFFPLVTIILGVEYITYRREGDKMTFETIPAKDVGKYMLMDNVLMIDLRDPSNFKKGHIYNAINIPYARIERGDFSLPKNYKLVLYCERGGKSFSAARILTSMEFDVIAVAGGMQMYFDS